MRQKLNLLRIEIFQDPCDAQSLCVQVGKLPCLFKPGFHASFALSINFFSKLWSNE